MKKILLPLLALCALASCQNVSRTVVEEEEERTEVVKNAKEVTFVMKGITADYASRATVESEGLTDLYIYEGTTLLAHKVSTDADFDTPTVTLEYGSHDLTFVASKSEGQSFSSAWSCTKVKDTFGKAMNVTVSKGSSTSRQVELKRVNAKVQWTVEDKIPADAAKMKLSVTNYLGLSASLAGMSATTYEAESSCTSWVGKTGVMPSVLVLPATYGEESDVTAVITFLKDDGSVLKTYSTQTTVMSNRCTNIHGSFFGKGDASSITIDTTWLEQKDVDL